MEKAVGKRIKELRKALNLSQEKFALECELSTSLVSKAETNLIPVTLDMIEAICKRFEVPQDWLQSGKGKMTFVKTEKVTANSNPWESQLYNDLKDEIKFLRELLRARMGEKSFLNRPFKAATVKTLSVVRGRKAA